MPGGSTQTTRKQDQGKPTKQKRTHSDVSQDGSYVESGDLQNIHKELQEIKECLRGSVSRGDLDKAMSSVVKADELKKIVVNIVTEILQSFKEEYETKLRENSNKLNDKMDALMIDNESLREKIHKQENTIREMSDTVRETGYRADLALKQANFNEQYSRKCNIKVVNQPEVEQENLQDVFRNAVKSDLDITLQPDDIQAIHRIPGRRDEPRPIIVKLKNSEVKKTIMRKKKNLKNNIRFLEDITKRNMSLMWKLKQHDKIEGAWCYNGSIYGQSNGKRIKFDILDNIDSKIS